MNFKLRISSNASKDIEKLRKIGNKSILNKLDVLLDELTEHPTTGTGKPEKLKHLSNYWSRRITSKHRLVYEIKDEIVTVVVIQSYGHYNDK